MNEAKTQVWTETGQGQRARARQTLQEGWIEFIDRYPWQWFCTLTFGEDVHPQQADRTFRLWVAKLNRYLFGSRWSKKPARILFWIRATEDQRRGVLHFHVLVGCPTKDLAHPAVRAFAKKSWLELAGFSKIESIRSQTRVSRYLTKGVKRGCEIDVCPNLPAVTCITWNADYQISGGGPDHG